MNDEPKFYLGQRVKIHYGEDTVGYGRIVSGRLTVLDAYDKDKIYDGYTVQVSMSVTWKYADSIIGAEYVFFAESCISEAE